MTKGLRRFPYFVLRMLLVFSGFGCAAPGAKSQSGLHEQGSPEGSTREVLLPGQESAPANITRSYLLVDGTKIREIASNDGDGGLQSHGSIEGNVKVALLPGGYSIVAEIKKGEETVPCGTFELQAVAGHHYSLHQQFKNGGFRKLPTGKAVYAVEDRCVLSDEAERRDIQVGPPTVRAFQLNGNAKLPSADSIPPLQ
jgi:hypothetical protein